MLLEPQCEVGGVLQSDGQDETLIPGLDVLQRGVVLRRHLSLDNPGAAAVMDGGRGEEGSIHTGTDKGQIYSPALTVYGERAYVPTAFRRRPQDASRGPGSTDLHEGK
jgi:hypothetical protein